MNGKQKEEKSDKKRNEMKALLIRLSDDGKQTLGLLQFFEKEDKIAECKTLELPWRDNQRNISCIPRGDYNVRKHYSPRFGYTFWLTNVPNRSEILIHQGNFNRQTQGCILVGSNFLDIDGDGNKDVTSSVVTMKMLLAVADDNFRLLIV